MKNYIYIVSLSLALTLIISCEESKINGYNENELIFVVEMNSTENKSTDDIVKFSKYYTDAIDKMESNSLGWGFYESGEKIILIERYLDGKAMMQHGKNVSEGGPLEAHFVKFMEHFTINKIDVYGNSSDELKEFVKGFGLSFYFHPAYAKFSRN